MKKGIILINRISDKPTEDELDVLHQAEEVETALKNIGYSTERLFMGLNLEETRDILLSKKPELVFNLVECIDGKASLIHLAPALLQILNMHFTGCRLESMFVSSNKILAKKILRNNHINTPEYFTGPENDKLDLQKKYIAKPTWEDASVGITDQNVFWGSDKETLDAFINKWGDAFFIEEFVEGREFNVSVLGGREGPEVMPMAEMIFMDFPENKPKIVGYAAKWDEGTFEYLNTSRTFDFDKSDIPLREEIKKIAMECWRAFGLSGYSRVDLRVDKNNIPSVLEINANPCLSRDAGFFAACEQAGLSYEEMVRRIIYDAYI